MTGIRGIRSDFKSRISEIINAFEVAEKPGIAQYTGGKEAPPLEHATRVNFLDDLMRALGWSLEGNREVLQEARIVAETTTFIDYLGIDSNRDPIIIVEAKAWDKPLIKTSRSRVNQDPTELLQRAIDYAHISASDRENSQTPVISEWQEWIDQVFGYVKDLNIKGHAVKRLVITSGQWMVIFKDPVETFCNRVRLDTDNVTTFELKDYITESDTILSLLAKDILAKEHPYSYRPRDLNSLISSNTIRGAFLSVMLTKQPMGVGELDAVPIILIQSSLLLLRDDGELLHVHNENEQATTLPHEYEEIPSHLTRLNNRSTTLINMVKAQLNISIEILPVNQFPGFRKRYPISPMTGDEFTNNKEYVLPRESTANEYIVATGANSHYLLAPSPEAFGCRFHDWAVCNDEGYAVLDKPVIFRSTKDPVSFFKTSETHHCAQSVMHGHRENKCQIEAFERHACCKTCAFETVCWAHEEFSNLPCGK